MFTTSNRLMLGSPSITPLEFLDAKQAAMGALSMEFWGLDDSFNSTIGSVDNRYDVSSSAIDRTYSGATSGNAPIVPLLGSNSGHCFSSGSNNGTIEVGIISTFSSFEDITHQHIFQGNGPAQAGVNPWVYGRNAGGSPAIYFTFASPYTGSVVNLQDSVGIYNATNLDISPLNILDGNPHLFTWVQKKDGATYDYYYYIDTTMIYSALNKGRIFATNQAHVFGAVNFTDAFSSMYYQGIMTSSTVENGGGAWTADEISTYYDALGLP